MGFKYPVKILYTIRAHKDRINTCCITSDDKYIVSTSNDNTIKIFELETAKEIRSITAHTRGVKCGDVSHNMKLIISCGQYENSIRLWDFETGNMVTEILKCHTGDIEYCKFNKDASLFGTCSKDNTAKLWDTKTGECKQIFEGHENEVSLIDFSIDGKNVITSSLDKTVRQWDISTKTCTTFSGHSGRILNAGYSPSGKYIMSASWDKTVKLWDPTGKYLVTVDDAENSTLNDIYLVTATYSQHSLIIYKIIE